jgi:hypothetical protein
MAEHRTDEHRRRRIGYSVLSYPKRQAWHTRGMSRIRLSTTVDADLLGIARSVRSGLTDAALIDAALAALLA